MGDTRGNENGRQEHEIRTQPLGEEEEQALARRLAERMPREAREQFIQGLRDLSPQERKEIVGLLLPEQRTTNQIWLIIVSSFAFVLILSVAALCYGVLWNVAGEIQILLTIVTTVAGILAGFVSGRASTGSTTP
jgi:hypothetical protein